MSASNFFWPVPGRRRARPYDLAGSCSLSRGKSDYLTSDTANRVVPAQFMENTNMILSVARMTKLLPKLTELRDCMGLRDSRFKSLK